MTSALVKRDEGWRDIIRETYREMKATWKPHRD
jgi:hypothetical protein